MSTNEARLELAASIGRLQTFLPTDEQKVAQLLWSAAGSARINFDDLHRLWLLTDEAIKRGGDGRDAAEKVRVAVNRLLSLVS
jgi:hypothetical protein